MTLLLRLATAAVSGLAGLGAIVLAQGPAFDNAHRTWLLICISLLLAGTLVSTVSGVLNARRESAGNTEPPPATAADREVHGEVTKIMGLLKHQVEVTNSFSAALARAREQLPDTLRPEQVRIVVSYLLIENENMRNRTAELQSNLEKSQSQIEKLKSNLAAAEAQGLIDPLTGLKNRRSFDISLAAEIAASRSAMKPVSLIMGDIDHFKAINDRYGHQTGDEVLKWFAGILSGNMKGRDTVARYGGEEFAIILPQTALEQAVILAGQIKQQLESQLWKKPGPANTMLHITASFGVAQLQDGEGTAGLIQRADAKLYEAKAAGRNRVAA